MTWGAIGGAAVGVIGNALTSDSGGGGGQSQTTSKEPWLAAQPWIMNNMVQGQNLQNQYAANPFNAQQQNAYGAQANQTAYMRAAVPSLLRQIQGQQVGFDRSNPNARPNAFSFDGLLSAAKEGQSAATQNQGLLDMLSNGGAVNSSLTPLAQAPKKQEEGTFTQQDMGYTPQQQALVSAGMNPYLMGYTQAVQAGGVNGGLGTGGYGEYRYGSTPQPGTQAYRDMTEYFLRGGNDPWNIAPGGMGIKRLGAPDYMYGMGPATDDGGAAAAVGSSANF